MNEKKFPARLHILVAREGESAIVIRRGPSKRTCIIGWDRRENTFQVSQWLKGRIYERRSDISPSGKYWIYFAMNGKWSSESSGAWTAISRSPWLKDICFFPKGDCWNGGGLFLDDKTYWLNDGYGHRVLRNSSEVKRNDKYIPSENYGNECLTVYYNKLQRDGWLMLPPFSKEKWLRGTSFQKELPKQWKLLKACYSGSDRPDGKGVYWDVHALERGDAKVIEYNDWEWADWFDNSIHYACKGKLYRLSVKDENSLAKPELLHDFNTYEFEQLEAPY